MENPGGNEVKDVLHTFDHNGMAGIGAPLIADDDIGILGKIIDHFGFAFIAPLGPDRHYATHSHLKVLWYE
jgi:hypothetical protein